MPMLNLALEPASSVGRASCPPFVTPDFDPGVAPASLPAIRQQPARRPVLLDDRVHGHDDRQDACPTKEKP